MYVLSCNVLVCFSAGSGAQGDCMKRFALFVLSALLWCVSVLDLAKRLPEHQLPEDYSDILRAEFMEFAMATDTELPPMDGGLDAFWAAMATRTTAGEDHPFATLSAVMKVYLLMPHSNADSELVFSMVNKIDTEHRSELAQDTIAALLSVKMNCTADTHSYEPPATVLHMSKKATMNYNLLHRNTP